VKLELNHAAFEALGQGEVLGEFTRELAVDIELEVVALGDDVHVVPLALFDVGHLKPIFDRGNRRLVILANHKHIATKTTMLATAGGMKIPSPQHLPTDAHMTKVSMVALKIPATSLVRNRPNAHTAVTLAGKAVAEFQLKVGHVFVFAVSQIAAPLVAGSHNRAVFGFPGRGTLGRRCLPSVEGLAIKDGDKAILALLFIFRPSLE